MTTNADFPETLRLKTVMAGIIIVHDCIVSTSSLILDPEIEPCRFYQQVYARHYAEDSLWKAQESLEAIRLKARHSVHQDLGIL